MARKRLNDTAALASIPEFNPSGNSHHSVSIRKIDNGFIKTESSCVDGRYSSSEKFTASKPNPSPDTGNSMAKAKAYLEKTSTI